MTNAQMMMKLALENQRNKHEKEMEKKEEEIRHLVHAMELQSQAVEDERLEAESERMKHTMAMNEKDAEIESLKDEMEEMEQNYDYVLGRLHKAKAEIEALKGVSEKDEDKVMFLSDFLAMVKRSNYYNTPTQRTIAANVPKYDKVRRGNGPMYTSRYRASDLHAHFWTLLAEGKLVNNNQI